MIPSTPLCGRPSTVHGAGGCPRRQGHRGECYWWLAWEDAGAWRVIVYSGEPYHRRRRCMGAFTSEPDVRDVSHLLRVLSPLKKREVARRGPASEPQPRCTPIYRLDERCEDGKVAVLGG